MHDLENVINVMWTWQQVTVTSFTGICPCILERERQGEGENASQSAYLTSCGTAVTLTFDLKI